MGAEGKTKRVMNSLLQFPEDRRLITEFRNVISMINPPNRNYVLETANSIFVDQTYTLQLKFKEILKSYFKSEIMNTDFKDAKTSAR